MSSVLITSGDRPFQLPNSILRDRVKWMKDTLSGSELQVQLVNLFDRSTGSGRNVDDHSSSALTF
jgi:hypothetical protein